MQAIGGHVLAGAQAPGIRLGKVEVVDNAHTVADVDNAADGERQKQGEPRVSQKTLEDLK